MTVVAGIVVITCLTVVRLQKCLQISSNTAKRSLMGTGMLVLSMQSSMHWGAVLSSSRNEYLYWLVGTSACRLVGGACGRAGAEVEADLFFTEPNPNEPAIGEACIDLCGGGGGTDVDDDVGATSLVDFWISGKKSSSEMVVAWFSGFLQGRMWTPSNFMHCFPLSLDTLST